MKIAPACRTRGTSRHRFPRLNRKMLGREALDDLDHRVFVAGVDEPRAFGEARDATISLRPVSRAKSPSAVGNALQDFAARSKRPRHARRIVLRLRDHLTGYELRPRALIGDDQHFRRPGKSVDSAHAENLAFGLGDPDVPGTDDLVDRRDRRGADTPARRSLARRRRHTARRPRTARTHTESPD